MSGSEPERGFATDEYRRRLSALQARMNAADIGALLLTTEPDIQYVTGFLTRFWESPARPWFVVVPASGDPVAVIPSIGAALMAKTWIDDIRSWVSPDLTDDGVTLLADTISDLLPGSGRIGLPMGHETHLRMPVADFERLKAAVAPRTVVDATQIVRHVREVKSAAEIGKIRTACSIADRAFARVPGFAGAGRPLDCIFRDFQISCLQEGADRVGYLAGGAGPDGYDDVISPASPTLLKVGDILMLDTGVVHDGYYCDFDRNYAVGQPSDIARRSYGTLVAATEAGLAAARPGARASDLHRVMKEAIERAGCVPASGRFGHGLGIQLTEWPSLIPADQTVLRPGMVLTLEPGVSTTGGRIMVLEENIVVTETGCELLSTPAPAAMTVLQ